MKVLGEKSLTIWDAIYKFFCLSKADKNTVKELTRNNCKVYHLNCVYRDNRFFLAEKHWVSSRRIVDILSQINQHSGGSKPYVAVNCYCEDNREVENFHYCKLGWIKSFRLIKVV